MPLTGLCVITLRRGIQVCVNQLSACAICGRANPLAIGVIGGNAVAIIRDRSPQSFFKCDIGGIAQPFTRPRDRRERMPHVTRARLVMQRLDFDADEIGDVLPQHANARRGTAADIEHAAGDLFSGRLTGEQICLHDIRDEGEVARLPTVAEDDRGSAAQRGGDEQRYDGSIVGVEILTWSENVEVA